MTLVDIAVRWSRTREQCSLSNEILESNVAWVMKYGGIHHERDMRDKNNHCLGIKNGGHFEHP